MTKPSHIDPLADQVLELLAGAPEAGEIVIGGYLALQHHLDYRPTHDIDAWWRTRASPTAERAIRSAMEKVAVERRDELRERRFGETISFELFRAGKRSFSFQIAVRSVELEPPVASAWPPILIETLADTIGSKMNALVDRGAPRDFLDLQKIVEHGLAKIAECWAFWGRKNSGQSIDEAKQKTLLHLQSLEARRPLHAIASAEDRQQAQITRDWFHREFLRP